VKQPLGPPVNVTYDPNAEPQFTFEPKTVRMRGPGIVVLKRTPPTADWKFIAGEVKDDTLNEFSTSVPGDGEILQIQDDFRDRKFEAYSYSVTVQIGEQKPVTSPDPVIVNDPGTAV
jgi:hypothetical protein